MSADLPGDYALPAQLLRFCHCLREAGLRIPPSATQAFAGALRHVDIGQRQDFKCAARATLLDSREDFDTFERVFEEFWQAPRDTRERPARDTHEQRETGTTPNTRHQPAQPTPAARHTGNETSGNTPQGDEPRQTELLAYSPVDEFAQRDIGSLDEQGIARARVVLQQLIRALASRPSRRHRPSPGRAELDFRRSFRRSLRHGFEGLALEYRRPRPRRPSLLLLCDVSGSMARYSRFLLEFVFALRAELPRIEAAVFATRLTPITAPLAQNDLRTSFSAVVASTSRWGSGTDIGRALAEFNDVHAGRMLQRRSVVVILSDGWDRGDARLMREEIAALRRRAHRVIWLNPLLGRSGYQPLCRGMRTALPYLDHFLPAHNLASLADATRLLLRGE